VATPPTLDQMIDEVRRYIQILPPIDYATPGTSGAAPAGQPDPNNNMIIQAINDGIDAINSVVRVGLEVDLTIATALPPNIKRGAFYVDVSSVIPNPLTAGEVTDVTWTDGNNYMRLAPTDYYAAEKDYTQFQQLAPSQPQYFTVSGSQIGIVPPPSTTGTLYFNALTTIPNLVNGSDTITILPVEYQPAVIYWAVVFLSIRQATDVEAATRAQAFGPIATQRTLLIYAWKNGFDNTAIPSVREVLNMMWMQRNPQDLQSAQPQQGGEQ
jgi:hypothetical protein